MKKGNSESMLLCVGLVTESRESYDYYDYNELLFKVLFHITFLDRGLGKRRFVKRIRVYSCIHNLYVIFIEHVMKNLLFNITKR